MGRRKIIHNDSGELLFVERRAVTLNEAYVNLFLAVRKQAICDNKLKEWEETWLNDPEISRILYRMLTDYKRKRSMESSVESICASSNCFSKM